MNITKPIVDLTYNLNNMEKYICTATIEDVDGTICFKKDTTYEVVEIPGKKINGENIKCFLNEKGQRHLVTRFFPDMWLNHFELVINQTK